MNFTDAELLAADCNSACVHVFSFAYSCLYEMLHPWKPTWQWKTNRLKMYPLLRMVIFHCQVSFQRWDVFACGPRTALTKQLFLLDKTEERVKDIAVDKSFIFFKLMKSSSCTHTPYKKKKWGTDGRRWSTHWYLSSAFSPRAIDLWKRRRRQ